MDNETIKAVTKFTVAIGTFVESWEEQKRALVELRYIVALICSRFESQFTPEERALISQYGQAYREETKTGTTPDNNPSTGQ